MGILIIEDDVLLNKGIAHTLSKEGYRVLTCMDYEEGIKLAKEASVELILLDINLKGRSGLALCKEIRAYSKVPIIFITARDTDQDMVEGFDVGGDDYIVKPFSLMVLKKRVEAMLRRTTKEDSDKLVDRDITIDYMKKCVYKKDELVKLTATEYKIIEILSKNRGQVLTREILLEKLWDIEGNFVEENTLSVHMRRIRIKLEDDCKNPEYICTVFGIGYTWGEGTK